LVHKVGRCRIIGVGTLANKHVHADSISRQKKHGTNRLVPCWIIQTALHKHPQEECCEGIECRMLQILHQLSTAPGAISLHDSLAAQKSTHHNPRLLGAQVLE
jgi:hypothetical protein